MPITAGVSVANPFTEYGSTGRPGLERGSRYVTDMHASYELRKDTAMSITTSSPATFDRDRAGTFRDQISAAYRGSMLTMMVSLSSRLGLLDDLGGSGPGTIESIAQRTGLSARHLRELLSALTVGGVLEYDAATQVFTLPSEHAFWLTGKRYQNLSAVSGLLTGLTPRLDDVESAFREGGGVSYDRYRPHFTHAMDAVGRARYDALLVSAYLPFAPGLVERLQNGARAGDVGCGTGHCLNLLAEAFPASQFVGFDISDEAIGLARAEAELMGLTNVSFEVADVLTLPVDPQFDVLFAFDAIHDQFDPAGVLRRIRDALAPDGDFFMVDIRASSNLEENIGESQALMAYGTSVMHCMQVSLHGGGAGLGTAWGTQLATSMLNEAGFGSVTVNNLEADPMNCIYVCR